MTLTAPLSFLPEFPGWITDFDPEFRQEMSRAAGGRTYVKDLGPSLWRMAGRSKVLSPNWLDYWRGRLQALENGLITFRGYSLSRTYPIRYPNGSWPTGGAFNGLTANLNTIAANRKVITVSALPPGFVLSVGDLIQIGSTDLHRVMETATAGGGGVTPSFEVRPHIWPGVTTATVSVFRPSCIMAIVAGSINTDSDMSGRGAVTFKAVEARE
jgi:hypothetical protein